MPNAADKDIFVTSDNGGGINLADYADAIETALEILQNQGQGGGMNASGQPQNATPRRGGGIGVVDAVIAIVLLYIGWKAFSSK